MTSRFWLALLVAGLGLSASATHGQRGSHLRVPEDTQPPVYTGAGGPSLLPDGTVFALADDEWAAIPFWRPADCIRPDFNLLESFDLAALDCPLLVEGFVRWRNGPASWEARGVETVPIWFVLRAELEQATADDELTIGELAGLGSLVVGTADFYHEQNHGFGIHPVSHLALVAWGTLEDGRRFSLQVVEVKLSLVQAHIAFR